MQVKSDSNPHVDVVWLDLRITKKGESATNTREFLRPNMSTLALALFRFTASLLNFQHSSPLR